MKFSLIILNIKKLIKEQRLFLFILIISQIAACLAIFFAIAAIANTRNEQKEIDIRTMYFEAYSVGTTFDNAGKTDYSKCDKIVDFQKKTERILSLIPQQQIGYCRIGGVVSEDVPIRYTAVKKANDDFVFTEKQLLNGEAIAAIGDEGYFSNKNKDDIITLGGTEYTIVEKGNYVGDIIIPLKNTPQNFIATSFRVELTSVPTKELVKEINEIMSTLFPEANIQTPEIPDLMTVQFNRTMIISSFFIILIVAINLSYCYCYLFIKRKKMISSYIICGCSYKRAVSLMTAESVIISLLCLIIAVFAMELISPYLTAVYPAAENLYNYKLYHLLGVAYIVTIIILLSVMFSSLMKKSANEMRKGG